jgi:hypothetical protein
MARGSYTGGSSTIRVFGTTAKPSGNKRYSGVGNRLNSNIIKKPIYSTIDRQRVEKALNKISYYKQLNNINAIYKYAVIVCHCLSESKKNKKNKTYTDYIFSKMYELGIDKDVLKIEVKKTLKRFLNKKNI